MIEQLVAELSAQINNELKKAQDNTIYYRGAIDGMNLLAEKIKEDEDNKSRTKTRRKKATRKKTR